MKKTLLFVLALIALGCGESAEEEMARRRAALNSLEVLNYAINCDWGAYGNTLLGCDGTLTVRNDSDETLSSIGVGWEIYRTSTEGSCPSRVSMATKWWNRRELPPGGQVQLTFQVASSFDRNIPRRMSYCLSPSDVRIKTEG
jgi:hypothetical protein